MEIKIIPDAIIFPCGEIKYQWEGLRIEDIIINGDCGFDELLPLSKYHKIIEYLENLVTN